MQIPEEFGNYLLLKKLGEDPLGETFRAGKVGREGLGQVVLLRVWNGRGLEGDHFGEALAARAAVQQALRSPNIGTGVDLGRVRNFSYVAYDYISGKNLEALAAQAARAHQPIPPDHALLIVERLALAVAAGYETRVKDERVLHGFVVPQLVMVSNEGETRLLGFEAAPGLREAAAVGAFPPEITRYLAPEALTGAATAKNDDVWSLAAILLELLTGRPLPEAPAEGYGAVVDDAALAQEGSPLPAPLVALLKKSLLPRAERVADAVVWHKTLAKLMIEGHYSPTTFNLAFFMHNLFREDIERESQELQAERKLDVSERVRSAPPPAAAPVHDVRESTGVREAPVRETTGVYYPGQAAAQKRSKAPLFIGLAAVLAAALGVGGWMMYGRKPQAPPSRQAAAPPPAPRPAPVQPAAPVMTQEQIDAQIKALIEQRSQALEEAYRKQTDEQIRILQRQLEESRKAAAAAAAEREERQAAATTATPAAPDPAAPDPAAETRAAARPTAEGTGAPPAQTAAQPGQAAAVPASAVERHDPPPAAAEPAVSAPAAPVPAPQPQVRVGDLVTALGPGVVPPQRTSELRAVYPPAAERLRKSATVNVRVLVDENGKVLQAERVGPTVGFGFDDAAIDAARRVRFRPATKDGIRVKMWTTLRVAFQP